MQLRVHVVSEDYSEASCSDQTLSGMIEKVHLQVSKLQPLQQSLG